MKNGEIELLKLRKKKFDDVQRLLCGEPGILNLNLLRNAAEAQLEIGMTKARVFQDYQGALDSWAQVKDLIPAFYHQFKVEATPETDYITYFSKTIRLKYAFIFCGWLNLPEQFDKVIQQYRTFDFWGCEKNPDGSFKIVNKDQLFDANYILLKYETHAWCRGRWDEARHYEPLYPHVEPFLKKEVPRIMALREGFKAVGRGDQTAFDGALEKCLKEFLFRKKIKEHGAAIDGYEFSNDVVLDMESLALATLARSRGLQVKADSPFLPQGLLALQTLKDDQGNIIPWPEKPLGPVLED